MKVEKATKDIFGPIHRVNKKQWDFYHIEDENAFMEQSGTFQFIF